MKVFLPKKQAEIRMGVMSAIVPESDLFIVNRFEKEEKKPVKIRKEVERSAPQAEINVLGQTVSEGVMNVIAVPFLPALPVLPTLCMYISGSCGIV